MKSSDYQEEIPTEHPVTNSLSSQSILFNVLQAALKPHPFQVKIRNILDFITRQKHLGLGDRGVFFLIDQATETMTLKITNRLATKDDTPCCDQPIGICHCGQVALSGKAQYFSSPPPLHDFSHNPQPFPGTFCVPVTKDNRTLAVLSIYVANRQPPSDEVQSLLEAVANIFAVIIETQQMDQQSITLVNDLRSSMINLREEKKFSESIIQGLKYGLIVANLKGKIVKSNGAAEAILKPFANSLDNRYLSDIFDDQTVAKLLEVLPPGAEKIEREVTVSDQDSDKKIIGYSNVNLEDARDKKVGVIISMADISELKYVRKEMEKMNRLSTVAEIASAVAHEVRNPLAGIKIMAQSIEEEAGANSDQLECSQRIIRQVDRLNILLSDFFSYAKPAEPKKSPTALSTILEETKPLINSRLIKSNIILKEDIPDRLPPILADPHQVQQVFLNLFLNAIDAICQQGVISIKAKLTGLRELKQYKREYPGILSDVPYIVVHFTDNGSGMPHSTVDQVFDPFFTTKASGTGLGLSIVYRTLKENDAEIVLTSDEGKGSTFTLFFQAAM